MYHDAIIQLVRFQAGVNIIGIGIVHRAPLDPGTALVFLGTLHDQVVYGGRLISRPFSKDEEAADGKRSRRHMDVFKLDVTSLYRSLQLHLFMRNIGSVVT